MVRGQWGNLARMSGLHPYSYSKDILGFLMTTESQDLGLTSHPKDGVHSWKQCEGFTCSRRNCCTGKKWIITSNPH